MADQVVHDILAEAAEDMANAEEVQGCPEILADASPDDPEPPQQEEPRQKRQRRPRPAEVCPGRNGVACIFSLQASAFGQAARVQRGEAACTWCTPTRLGEQLQDPRRRKNVTRALRLWSDAEQEAVLDLAWGRLPADSHAGLRQALARPSRAQATVAARRAASAEAQSWSTLLSRRVALGLPMPAETEAIYRSKRRDDERRLRAKFGPVLDARAEGDESWRSPLATRFEAWCRENSWALCEQCHRLEQRSLQERDITGARPAKHAVRRCRYCRTGSGYPTVSPDLIPQELQNLSTDALWALRPLSPDVGPPVFAKHGYRVHTDMIRFWWRPQTVEAQLRMLTKDEDRTAARAAFRYLMGASDSSYAKFVHMHSQFLRRNRARLTGEARDGPLRLPRRALEEEGLECSVWPHLYPRTCMCETHIRRADVRRRDMGAQQVSALASVVAGADSHSDSEDAADPAEVVSEARPLLRWTSLDPGATPRRVPTSPRCSAPLSDTARTTSCSNSFTTSGCGVHSGPRRTWWRHPCAWRWPDIPFPRNIGKLATRA